MATVAETPHTLEEANALLSDPEAEFVQPTQPWPAGAYITIGGGISGYPESKAHWDPTAAPGGGPGSGAFVPDVVPFSDLDLTKTILGNQNEDSIKGNISDSLAELKISSTHGDGRLSAANALLFVADTYVQLSDGKAYYDSGQSGTPPTGSSSGTWKQGPSPADAPAKVTGVNSGQPGSWVPAGVDAPADLTYANAIASGSPSNGFIKPTVPWVTDDYVELGDDTQAHWDTTTSMFAAGPVIAAP